ncbi:MAG: iron-sulfur cluster assembly protein, partial [Bacteroidota bacterium]
MDKANFKEKAIEIIKTVYDPEIPVDIYELGLIYEIDIDDNGTAIVRMTLTSPA